MLIKHSYKICNSEYSANPKKIWTNKLVDGKHFCVAFVLAFVQNKIKWNEKKTYYDDDNFTKPQTYTWDKFINES